MRVDGTPKPAYFALQDLFKGEWWMKPAIVVTDDAGRVTIGGIAGTYAVTVGGKTASVDASSTELWNTTATVG